jgi:zinc/manganese transport system substrate-binding protein
MKLLWNSVIALLAFFAWASVACADGLKVVASFSIIGDMAREVGGTKVSVTTLVGPDSDAHVYEPRPQDAAAMAEADVVLVNGLGFEGFIERLAQTSAPKSAPVELSKGIATLDIVKDDHGHEEEGHDHEGGIDPHAFQSVTNAQIYVRNIVDAFCKSDTANCDAYKANAATYNAKLAALDSEIKTAIASIPADKRIVITSHDAFGYFANAYGLTFHAPEGISTESEASAADVAKLIDQIRKEKASAIFVENISDTRLIAQISKEAGVQVGGSLYSDALSGPDGPAASYIDMMRHNVMTIKGAILGS